MDPAIQSDADAAKATLRRRFRQRRHLALERDPQAIARAAAAALPPLLSPGSRLGLYWPIGQEPDLIPLAEALIAAGFGIALPAISAERLLYRPWRPGDPLSPDACGIPAPADGPALAPAALGLLLAPALAFDRHGIRLGYGGGWFDRLRADPPWRAVPALAVLPRACLLKGLPADPWDVPFPGWLDERGVHWLQAV